jgi:glutamyl-tRNA synthetase
MTQRVRTRFAPSPTGFLHIGGARTALFAWAFARHFGGDFILRIEDTDVERSSPEAVQGILDGMAWLDLAHDEGPFYQMQRMERYKEVIQGMLAAGTAYYCYTSTAELDELRESQRAAGLKPRYDGRWRPENAAGKTPPAGVKPVVRFKNPLDGVVQWDDLVKGSISIANQEMDDLVIARPDGTPTYNFCVVVDDWDMQISHVIRGDDHVNNTPRQINILQALGAPLPRYGHLPMILGPDGQKLSKRRNAVSVMDYDEAGYLPEAVVNYLARLGWSHGDDEIFSREQLVSWFDGSHLSHSPSQLDFEKFKWVNQHYLKLLGTEELVRRCLPRLKKMVLEAQAKANDAQSKANDAQDEGISATDLKLAAVKGDHWIAYSWVEICALLRERCSTLQELTEQMAWFVAAPEISDDDKKTHLDDSAVARLPGLAKELASCDWTKAGISGAIKGYAVAAGVKMPQVAIPARLAVFGRSQTPAIDAMLAMLPREEVLERLRQLE